MIQDILRDLAVGWSLDIPVIDLEQFGNELLERIIAKHADSDKGDRIGTLMQEKYDLEGQLKVKEAELASETQALAASRCALATLRTELEGYKSMITRINERVFPGVADSEDCLREIVANEALFRKTLTTISQFTDQCAATPAAKLALEALKRSTK
jgi:hypothetical protein